MTTKGKTWDWDSRKIKREITDNVKVFSDKGNCNYHPNPDIWFASEVNFLGRRGSPSPAQIEQKFIQSAEALRLCKSCPIKQECLDEGMRKENLDYGIWGGMLAGERLLQAGQSILSSERKNKVAFAKQMRERYNI